MILVLKFGIIKEVKYMALKDESLETRVTKVEDEVEVLKGLEI